MYVYKLQLNGLIQILTDTVILASTGSGMTPYVSNDPPKIKKFITVTLGLQKRETNHN